MFKIIIFFFGKRYSNFSCNKVVEFFDGNTVEKHKKTKKNK